MKKLIFLLVIVSSTGCQRPEDDVLKDANGVVTRLSHLWKSSISANGELASSMAAQHIYDNRYLLSTQRNPDFGGLRISDSFCMKSLEDGKNKWVWNDLFVPNEFTSVFNRYIYAYENLLFYKNSYRFYCIDQESGRTLSLIHI